MTTNSTTTTTTASERPEVPAEVLVTIETTMGQIGAIQDAIEDWGQGDWGDPESRPPSSIDEIWSAHAALNIASNLLRLYTRGDPPFTDYSSARYSEVEPGERPAVSWELVREPLHDAAHRVSTIMEEARRSYQERVGDNTGLPESWVELHQVRAAVCLALSILALYEDRRVRPSPEPEEPEERPQPCTCTACGQYTADMRFHRCPTSTSPETGGS